MKRLCFIAGAFFLTHLAWAQDSLIFSNGDTVIAKVLEVSHSRIVYEVKQADHLNVIDVSRNRLYKVKYPNGYQDVFGEYSPDNGPGRNMVSVNMVDFFSKNLTIVPQHFFKGGRFSILLPVSIAMSPNNIDFSIHINHLRTGSIVLRNKIRVGVEMNYFPTGQGRFKYYTGLGIGYGQMAYKNKNETGLYTGNAVYYKAYITNGLLVKVTRHFYFTAYLAAGLTLFEEQNDVFVGNPLFLSVGFNVGYRFNLN